jgi:hypothetical protein
MSMASTTAMVVAAWVTPVVTCLDWYQLASAMKVVGLRMQQQQQQQQQQQRRRRRHRWLLCQAPWPPATAAWKTWSSAWMGQRTAGSRQRQQACSCPAAAAAAHLTQAAAAAAAAAQAGRHPETHLLTCRLCRAVRVVQAHLGASEAGSFKDRGCFSVSLLPHDVATSAGPVPRWRGGCCHLALLSTRPPLRCTPAGVLQAGVVPLLRKGVGCVPYLYAFLVT